MDFNEIRCRGPYTKFLIKREFCKNQHGVSCTLRKPTLMAATNTSLEKVVWVRQLSHK
jgi:hypothetical protein